MGTRSGVVSNDTFSAIAGRVGAGPPSIPLRVSARLRGTSRRVTLDSRLADERALDLGAGISLIAPLAASTAIDRLLNSLEPARLTVCTRFRVRELRRPIGFCNPYFDSFEAFGDVAEAASLVDSFDLAALHIRGAGVTIAAERGFGDQVLVGAQGPSRVRAGSTMEVRIALRRRGGGKRSVTARVPVPAGLRPGQRTLVLEGNGIPEGEDDLLIELEEGLSGRDGLRAVASEPRSPEQLARAVAALRSPLGITAGFRKREPRVVVRSNEVRYDGRVRVKLRVVRAPR